jgi:phage/plasmid-like protein (TIGR03299 family)
MAHEIETMFWAGNEVPWHGLGRKVDEALTSEDAIKMSGLDWTVHPVPLYTHRTEKVKGQEMEYAYEVENYKANVRSSDNSVLGVVTDRYRIVQNAQAFAFTDALIEEGVVYETAGSLRDGKIVWLLAKMPEVKILKDKTVPYLVFTNSHDGSGAVKAALTPIRVVCQNTLNFALAGAQRTWSMRHVGDIDYKLSEAKRTLELADTYMKKFNKVAEEFSQIKVSDKQVREILNQVIPMPVTESSKNKTATKAVREIVNVQKMHDAFFNAYNNVTNIKQFKGTAWGVINAFSDFATHTRPLRVTSVSKERMFEKVIGGHETIDKAFDLLSDLAA